MTDFGNVFRWANMLLSYSHDDQSEDKETAQGTQEPWRVTVHYKATRDIFNLCSNKNRHGEQIKAGTTATSFS